MNSPQNNPDPTADWRKYKRGPNFLGIVLGSAVALILLLIAAWFLLHSDSHRLLPHGPNSQPNSQVRPLLSSEAAARNG